LKPSSVRSKGKQASLVRKPHPRPLYEALDGAKKGKRVKMEPRNLTQDEWNEVSRHKTLQYAVLEQIRDNCKQLGSLKKELQEEVRPLELSCNKLS